MKTFLALVAGLALTTGLARAQTSPGSGSASNSISGDCQLTNAVSQNNDYEHLWSTNCMTMTNTPVAWSNNFAHVYAGKSAAGGGGQVQNRFGKTELPADVQTIVQKFEQDRTRLMSQLKTCSDEQRQQILKDMDQLRTQQRDQISKIRDDARQQAEQMRSRFGNNRDAVLNQGAGNSSPGRDR